MSSAADHSSVYAQLTLPADQLSRIVNLLENFSSPDNSLRKQAEDELTQYWVNQYPSHLVVALCQLCSHQGNPLLASMSCVLLRRLCFKPFVVPSIPREKGILWKTFDANTKDCIKDILLQVFLTQSLQAHVKNKLADVIAEIARTSSGNWPALLDAILTGTASSETQSVEHSAACLRIIYSYPLIVKPFSESVLKGYFCGLLNENHPDVLLNETIKAFVAVVISASQNTSIRNSLASLMNHVLAIITKMTSSNSGDLLLESLSSLAELADEYPKFFKDFLAPLTNILVMIVLNERDLIEDQARHVAVELYVTLCENMPKAMKKLASADKHKMLRVIFEKMLPDVQEDEEDWFECETLEDSPSSSVENYAVAEQAIDRISLALGGLYVLPVAFEVIPRFMQSNKWEERRGALMSIAYLAEGCSEALHEHLDGIMKMVFAAFQDPNQRVRYAACHALGQLCTDFQETLQEKYHYQCAESLIGALMNPPNHPRVQTHAASALVNFCDGCEREILAPYLDGFVSNLIHLISSPKVYAQEQAVVTLSVISDVCAEGFCQYYQSVMPILIQIIENAKDQRYRALRAKAIDAATLVAMAVGQDVFRPQAKPVVDAMVEMQKNALSDDPIHTYLPSCWVRICTLFVQDFHPLMETVWPAVMKRAMQEPDIALLDAGEELSEDQQSGDWEFANFQGKKIGIRTSTLEEKCAAVENIQAYAEILKSSFAPYCDEVLNLLVSLFSFEYHDGVKIASVSALVPVFKCLLEASSEKGIDSAHVLNKWYSVLKELVDCIGSLDCSESEFICQVFDTLGQCILIFGERSFNSLELLQLLITTMVDLLKEISRAFSLFELEASKDPTNEPDEDVIDNEENILIEMSKLLRNLVQFYYGALKGLLGKEILPFFTAGLTSSRPIVRHVSICFFSDLIEFSGPLESVNFAELFCTKLYHSLHDSESDVRQAAAFTIGICALKGGSPYAQFCEACIPGLFELSKIPNSRNHDHVLVTENAISTLAKIFSVYANLENEKFVVEWMHLLPVVNDEDEHETVYKYFASIVAKYPQFWSSSVEAPFVCQQFVTAINSTSCSAQLKSALIPAFGQFLARFPADQAKSLLNSIPQDQLQGIPLNHLLQQ